LEEVQQIHSEEKGRLMKALDDVREKKVSIFWR